MKFDLADFLELDTKALMAINGGGTCGGGSCSSGGGSCSGGSRGSSSYGGSCSSGSSYGGSCGSGSYGGSCSGSYGGSCGGGSYGGSCSGSSYGGSCSGGTSYAGSCGGGSSYGGSCSGGGAVGGSCGGGSVVVKPLIPTPSVSAGSSEDNSTPSPTEPIPIYEGIFVENSDYGVANAKPGDKLKRDDETIVTLKQVDIDLAKAKLEKEAASNPANEQSNNITPEEVDSVTPSLEDNITEDTIISSERDVTTNHNVEETMTSSTEDLPNLETSGSPSSNNTISTSSAEDKISKSIQENKNKPYNYDTGYRCDNWVEEVLIDAGYDASEYLTAGTANAKTVQQHIDALTSSKTEGVDYTKTLPTADGAYVVFMDDGTQGGKPVNEHAAILVIKDGKATVWDNSSGNGGNPVYKQNEDGSYVKDAKGNKIVSYYDQGVDDTPVDTSCTNLDWCYKTYYYQKIQ